MSVSTRCRVGAVLALTFAIYACGSDRSTSSQGSGTQSPEAARIVDIVHAKMAELDLSAAVFGVWRGKEEVVVGAAGGSPLGVPASTDMRLRVGQPMEPMLSTVLWHLDGTGALRLDAPISRWLPDFPRADRITPRMLANSTSGISDYVTDPEFLKRFGDNPFHTWTAQELFDLANARPPLFDPGTSFAYAHSDLVVLGEVMQRATGKPLGDLIAQYVLNPLGMSRTHVVLTAQIEAPILHGYTDERKIFEDATFWNPTAFLHSGNMNSTVTDVGRWVRALGKGELLSDKQFQQMMGPSTAGLGPLTAQKYFAFGVPHMGDWLFMNPSYGGYNGVAFYDSKTSTTVVVYGTLGPTADADKDNAIPIGAAIATLLVPDRPPPLP
ncbi:serine hydrolase [Nocardia sp. SYP-A9097]|uniref:serine hydrolase domain-containing protein n=1 Tax=Nocardia sp. SYP-A9097 TaxID=2663237 RepID=UPI00129AD35F|nr:serine hydrolase domain-containing protein [Nocardia sp. SYP-A9097]MRH88066.1 serine hydrolase [Nocardia sp. SYP-A9097]